MINTNLNLPTILSTYLPTLNQYTPEELIPLQTSIKHEYLNINQKTSTHKNIFSPQSLNSPTLTFYISFLHNIFYFIFFILHTCKMFLLIILFLNHLIN